MTARTYPVDAVSGAPSYTGRALRQTLSALISGATSTRPLGAQSGVRPGTPSNTVSVASSTWTVTPHSGVLDVETAAAAGPYLYAFDANVTGSVNAAHATYTRWDGIYVQLSDQNESDGTSGTPGVAIVYVAGTASASPAMPTQPARSLLLAKIIVPQSGGGASSVVWLAPSCMVATAETIDTALSVAYTPTSGVADIGLSVTVNNPGTTSKWEVVANLDLEVVGASAGSMACTLNAGGTSHPQVFAVNELASRVGARQHASHTWLVTGMAAGQQVIKMQAQYITAATWRINSGHSHMLVRQVA